MENTELANYITQRKAAGATPDMIRHELVSAGWTESDVATALGEPPSISPDTFPPSPATQGPPILAHQGSPSVADSSAPSQGEVFAPELVQSVHTQEAAASAQLPMVSGSGAHQGVRVGLVLGISAGVVLLLGAGSAAAYYAGLLATPSPSVLLSEGFAAMQSVTSASFAATSTVTSVATAPSVGTTTSHMQIALSGRAHRSTASAHGAAADIMLSGTDHSYADGGTTGSATFALHIIYANQTPYINLSNLNVQVSLGNSAQMPPQAQLVVPMLVSVVNGAAASIENQWITLAASSTASVPVATSAPQEASDLSSLSSYIASGSYVDHAQVVDSEAIQGVSTYRVAVVLKFQPQLADLLKKLIADQATAMGTTTLDLSQAFSGMVGKDVRVDFWVGKSDKRFYQVAFSPIQLVSPQGGGQVTIAATTTFSGFNEPVSITAPTTARSLQDLIKTTFGTFLPPSP